MQRKFFYQNSLSRIESEYKNLEEKERNLESSRNIRIEVEIFLFSV